MSMFCRSSIRIGNTLDAPKSNESVTQGVVEWPEQTINVAEGLRAEKHLSCQPYRHVYGGEEVYSRQPPEHALQLTSSQGALPREAYLHHAWPWVQISEPIGLVNL